MTLIQIYFDYTDSHAAACVLARLIVVICLGASNGLIADTSRSLYAFSRDKGLPFSGFVSIVEEKHCVPVVAIILAGVFQMAFNSIYFVTAIVFAFSFSLILDHGVSRTIKSEFRFHT